MPAVAITSFGFLHGPAPAALLTADLRPFRDPHLDPALRYKDATDAAVRDAVMSTPGIRELAAALCGAVAAYLDPGLPGVPVTVAIGCAGGRHRAPIVAVRIAVLLGERGLEPSVAHRDLYRAVVERR